jgi:hypothetical protein
MPAASVPVSLLLLLIPLAAYAGDLPNPELTPGATDTRVTQENIGSTICVRGYTKRVRPPRYFTDSLKRRQIALYRYEDRNPQDYEEDHLIPLNIGGNPTDERNLWPQPRNSEWGADRKDELEYVLYRQVCAGRLALAQAQEAIARDWIEAYRKFVGTGRSRGGYRDE